MPVVSPETFPFASLIFSSAPLHTALPTTNDKEMYADCDCDDYLERYLERVCEFLHAMRDADAACDASRTLHRI